MSESSEPARDRLILALDFSSLDEARALAVSVRPWFKTVKVGLELYASEGPGAVRALRDDGFDVFVDLKLHDIPETMRRAAAAIARLGASHTTVHIASGAASLAAAVAGLALGSSENDRAAPTVGLGVTVLTSGDATASLLEAAVRSAARAGLGGVICAANDVELVRRFEPGLLTVVPGIRTRQVENDDQLRTGSPELAIAQGADLLVVGRPVTRAADPVAASRQLAATVAASM